MPITNQQAQILVQAWRNLSPQARHAQLTLPQRKQAQAAAAHQKKDAHTMLYELDASKIINLLGEQRAIGLARAANGSGITNSNASNSPVTAQQPQGPYPRINVAGNLQHPATEHQPQGPYPTLEIPPGVLERYKTNGSNIGFAPQASFARTPEAGSEFGAPLLPESGPFLEGFTLGLNPGQGMGAVLAQSESKLDSILEDVNPLLDQKPSGNDKRYQTLKVLGKGGMGLVQLVMDRQFFHRKVAKKTIIGGVMDEGQYLEFLREARNQGTFEHPNILSAYDFGVTQQPDGGLEPYLIMPIVKGSDLDKIVFEIGRKKLSAEKKYPLRQRLAWACSMCDGISYMHGLDKIHRDLKPANVMVGDKPGEFYVMDLGLAKGVDEHEEAPEGQPGDVVQLADENCAVPTLLVTLDEGFTKGTPQYMAPEHAEGTPTKKSDQSAIGMILYELIEGRMYRDVPKKVGPMGLLTNIMQDSRAFFAGYNNTPPELQSIIDKTTEHDVKNRYGSVKLLKADIQRYMDGEDVLAHNYPTQEKVLRSIRKHPGRSAGIAAAIVMGVVGAMGAVAIKANADKREAQLQQKTVSLEAKVNQTQIDARLKRIEDREKTVQSFIQRQDWNNATLSLAGLESLVDPNDQEAQRKISNYTDTIMGYTPLTISGTDLSRLKIQRINESEFQNIDLTLEKGTIQLTPGHYLITDPSPSSSEFRQVVQMIRGQERNITIVHPPKIDGFIFIPAQRGYVGVSASKRLIDVAGFYIGQKHITSGEYYNFLATITNSTERTKLTPHRILNTGTKELFTANYMRRARYPPENPALCLNSEMVTAYSTWWSAKHNLRARMPTEAQMRIALGENCGRTYVQGDDLDGEGIQVQLGSDFIGLTYSDLVRSENLPMIRTSIYGVKLGDQSDVARAFSGGVLRLGANYNSQYPPMHSTNPPYQTGLILGLTYAGARLAIDLEEK